MQYENDVLQFFSHEEGRLVPDGSIAEYRYEFTLTDHLGNARVTFSDMDDDGAIQTATEVLQTDHYYPFGMRMSLENAAGITANPPNKYLYNGKELQSDLDLNWYDYGARMYDPSIGRWNGVDLLAEAKPSWTPFRYGFNNPLSFIDPTGMLEGWYQTDPNTIPIYDPTVNSQEDLDEAGIDGEYVGQEIEVTMNYSDGSTKAWQGNSDGTKTPIYTASEVTITGKSNRPSTQPSFNATNPKSASVSYNDSRPGGIAVVANSLNATGALANETSKQFQIIQEGIKNNVQYFGSVDEPISEGIYATKYLTGKQSVQLMSALEKAQKVLTPTAVKGIGVFGVGMTLLDGGVNGFENHHFADVTLGLVFTVFVRATTSLNEYMCVIPL